MINKSMDYRKHYDLLIERAKTRNLTGYFERHHIIPRCLGGTNEKTNLVELTPEEHYVAHQLLIKMYPDNEKLVYAANKMAVSSKTTLRNNKRYGWIKRRHSLVCKKRVGIKNPSYGRPWYHCPDTLKNGKFLEKDVPLGWVKGRTPKIITECIVCQKATGSQLAKFCDRHRLEKRQEQVVQNRTHEWHTPAGIFSNAKDAADANNCCNKTMYNRANSDRYTDYFVVAKEDSLTS